MPDPSELEPLLRLMGDDSKIVRNGVLSGFVAFGPTLESALRTLPEPPDENSIAEILRDVDEHRRTTPLMSRTSEPPS